MPWLTCREKSHSPNLELQRNTQIKLANLKLTEIIPGLTHCINELFFVKVNTLFQPLSNPSVEAEKYS